MTKLRLLCVADPLSKKQREIYGIMGCSEDDVRALLGFSGQPAVHGLRRALAVGLQVREEGCYVVGRDARKLHGVGGLRPSPTPPISHAS